MGAELGIEVFTARSAADIAPVTNVVLHDWVRTGLIRPSILGARGKGTRRVFSFRDVVALRIAAQLREHGIAPAALRVVVAYVQKHERISAIRPLPPVYLALQGAKVFELDDVTTVGSFREPSMLPLTLIPLDDIVSQVQREARRLRLEEPPLGHFSENHQVRNAARRARSAA